MSDTPRTDAATIAHHCKAAEFARQLERELNEVRAQSERDMKAVVLATKGVEIIIAERDALADEVARLRDALSYPRYKDTAGLLIHAAELIESIQQNTPGKSYFTPHLLRAADDIKNALATPSTAQRMARRAPFEPIIKWLTEGGAKTQDIMDAIDQAREELAR